MKIRKLQLKGQETKLETALDWVQAEKDSRAPRIYAKRKVTLGGGAAAGEYAVAFSHHIRSRAGQRGLTYDLILDAMDFGEAIYKQGLVFYVVKKNSLPKAMHHNRKNKLNNLVVVMNEAEGIVLTCYKSSNGIRYIKKKGKELIRA